MAEIVGEQTLVKARSEGMQLMLPIKSEVDSLKINDAADYAAADDLLHRVMQANKIWQARVDPIIAPIRSGLQLLYDLKNDIKEPLDQYEKTLKASMRTFKLNEARALQAVEDARLAAIREEQEKARIAAEKAAAARTKQVRNRLIEQSAVASQAVSELKNAGPAAPVRAAHSVAKLKKTWEIQNLMAFLGGIVDGTIPIEVVKIEVNRTEMNEAFRIDAETVAAWPGVALIDDINISGRRS